MNTLPMENFRRLKKLHEKIVELESEIDVEYCNSVSRSDILIQDKQSELESMEVKFFKLLKEVCGVSSYCKKENM